ncbi:MAG: serine/threonine-protein kinase [Candidatus Eisenbacteria bacterium]
MTTRDEEALTAPAARIADGEAVDWARERDGSPGLGAELQGLERVARIAGAWRELGVTPEDDAPEEPVLFRWGDLEAREKLGEGAFGEVFRAWEPRLQREVALKLRRDAGEQESARAELAEARQLARVRHPHVVQVLGVDVRDGRAGLWTELVRGRTLEAELARRGPMGPDEAALIGLELCRALAAVHAAGLAHGDLKASNVMREDGGRIVLMDFGSVSEVSDRAPGAAAGGGSRTATALSAAPEVLAGERATPASDLYALGVLLYRLVTGAYPVQAATLDELRDKLARGDRTPLRAARPELPTAFVAAVERALESSPIERWQDAAAFERALVGALELASSFAPADPLAERAERRAAAAPRRRAVSPVMIGALAFAIAALLWSRGAFGPGFSPQALAPAGPPAGKAPTAEVVPPAGAPASAATPAPSEPAATAAPNGVPFAEATLWRSRGGERAALVTGASVSPGDHLFLEFEGAEPLHVYVLDEDEQGETFTLFPVAGSDLANPLPTSARHRLPGQRDGAPFDWVVTSAGGREHVLIVASRKPIAALDQLVASVAAAAPGRDVRYAVVPEEALATLRGIGGMAAAPAGARESKLERIARGLRAADHAGVWVRQLTLESR